MQLAWYAIYLSDVRRLPWRHIRHLPLGAMLRPCLRIRTSERTSMSS